jgi:hypothetical protein
MYRVFEVEGGYQIFWCPSAPVHYADKVPYDGKVYTKRQAAYRRCKQLNEGRIASDGTPKPGQGEQAA